MEDAFGRQSVCFRYDGQQHQRSLKTKDSAEARAMMGLVEHAVYKVSTGEMAVPKGVDPVEYIVWGDAAVAKAEKAAETEGKGQAPPLGEFVELYLSSQRGLKAKSTLRTERTHLGNLLRYLGEKADVPMDQVSDSMLDAFVQHRERQANPVTLIKERQTVKSLFDWAVCKGKVLHKSLATELRRPQAGVDRDEFRTLEEVEEIVGRGGLTDDEDLEYRESLFLTEDPNGETLSFVRDRPVSAGHC